MSAASVRTSGRRDNDGQRGAQMGTDPKAIQELTELVEAVYI